MKKIRVKAKNVKLIQDIEAWFIEDNEHSDFCFDEANGMSLDFNVPEHINAEKMLAEIKQEINDISFSLDAELYEYSIIEE